MIVTSAERKSETKRVPKGREIFSFQHLVQIWSNFVTQYDITLTLTQIAKVKSLRHVAMVAQQTDRRHLKSEFALFKTSSILLSFNQFIKCWLHFLGLNPRGLYLSLEKEKKLFCVHLLYKASAWNWEVSRSSRATTAKECTIKGDARAKLLFCYLNLLLFGSSRCRHRRLCLNFLLLWSKNFATMVTWRHNSPLYTRRRCPYHCNTAIASGIITGYGPVFPFSLAAVPEVLVKINWAQFPSPDECLFSPLTELNREEKSLRHVAIVAKTPYRCDPHILLPW